MIKHNIYFHIGMPKTATSYMQKHVFPFIPEINYLGKYFEEEKNFFDKDFRYDIIFLSYEDFIFKYKKAKLKEIFQGYLDKDMLISEEGIVGYVFLPNSNIITENNVNFVINVMKLLYVARCLNYEANFIMTLRSQVELLTSMYAENYNKFYRFNKNTNTFDKFMNFYIKENNILNFEFLNEVFANMTDAKVHYLFYEEMKTEPRTFQKELGKVLNKNLNEIEFTKVIVNASTDGKNKKIKKVTIYQFLQRVKYKYLKNYSIKVPNILKNILSFQLLSNKKVILSSLQKNHIEQFYEDKNKRFINMIKKGKDEIYL